MAVLLQDERGQSAVVRAEGADRAGELAAAVDAEAGDVARGFLESLRLLGDAMPSSIARAAQLKESRAPASG